MIERSTHLRKLIHDKDGVYMIDEECLRKKEALEKQKEMEWQRKRFKEKRDTPTPDKKEHP